VISSEDRSTTVDPDAESATAGGPVEADGVGPVGLGRAGGGCAIEVGPAVDGALGCADPADGSIDVSCTTGGSLSGAGSVDG
jgi:hypothetical protein